MATRAQRRQATQNRIKALSHPLRAEAFRLIRDDGPLSPRELAAELEADIRDVSYHVRKLREFNCIEEIASRPVRGAIQRFYRATDEHMIDTEEWSELAETEPQMALTLADESMQCIVDDYSASRRAGIVALDEEFWIVRTPLVMDKEGLRKVLDASQRYEDEVLSIASESSQRTSQGAEAVPVSFSVVFFKMPRRSRPLRP